MQLRGKECTRACCVFELVVWYVMIKHSLGLWWYLCLVWHLLHLLWFTKCVIIFCVCAIEMQTNHCVSLSLLVLYLNFRHRISTTELRAIQWKCKRWITEETSSCRYVNLLIRSLAALTRITLFEPARCPGQKKTCKWHEKRITANIKNNCVAYESAPIYRKECIVFP